MNYEQKIQKIKEASDRKEKRLLKRLELAKGKVKRPSMAKLKKDLQRVTNKIVRLMYPPICYTCDKPCVGSNPPQAGHHYSVGSHQGTRYDFDNLRVQGSCCNLHKSGEQLEFAYKLRKEIGEERYEALRLKAKAKHKWSREEVETLLVSRDQILASLL